MKHIWSPLNMSSKNTKRFSARGPQLDDLKVRVNPKETSSSAQEFPILSNPAPGTGAWFYHPDRSIDIAIIQVNFTVLRERGIDPGVFVSSDQIADRNMMKTLGVAPGDGVFVLGFPMNLGGIQRNYVIARQGSIARMAEMLDGRSRFFLLDAFVFPDNSGGPVVLKPDITAIEVTAAITKSYLIGIVLSYLTYSNYAVSPQTKRTRIIFG
jgi:S1-C subfamily serine protease